MDPAFVDRLRSAAQADMPGEPVVFAYLVGSPATDGARADSDTDIAVLPPAGWVPSNLPPCTTRIAEIIEPAARTDG